MLPALVWVISSSNKLQKQPASYLRGSLLLFQYLLSYLVRTTSDECKDHIIKLQCLNGLVAW